MQGVWHSPNTLRTTVHDDIFCNVNCAPLLTGLFIHAYKTVFRQGFFISKDMKSAQTFNSSLGYFDNILSLNDSRFDESASHLSK